MGRGFLPLTAPQPGPAMGCCLPGMDALSGPLRMKLLRRQQRPPGSSPRLPGTATHQMWSQPILSWKLSAMSVTNSRSCHVMIFSSTGRVRMQGSRRLDHGCGCCSGTHQVANRQTGTCGGSWGRPLTCLALRPRVHLLAVAATRDRVHQQCFAVLLLRDNDQPHGMGLLRGRKGGACMRSGSRRRAQPGSMRVGAAQPGLWPLRHTVLPDSQQSPDTGVAASVKGARQASPPGRQAALAPPTTTPDPRHQPPYTPPRCGQSPCPPIPLAG